MANWLVSATLSSPLAGDAPYLDALLEFEMAQRQGKADKILRGNECPPVGAVHIPCLRGSIGGVSGIPRCSAPILAPECDRHEHFAKRLAVENAELLHESQRLVVATGNSTFKSYRLPLRIRNVRDVRWFVGGAKRKNLLSLLDSVHAIGKKRSQGYGRVSEWEAVEVERDLSWFAETEHGTVLMRSLPWCDHLPKDLIGYRRDFGACQPPMWHPDRYMEIVIPS